MVLPHQLWTLANALSQYPAGQYCLCDFLGRHQCRYRARDLRERGNLRCTLSDGAARFLLGRADRTPLLTRNASDIFGHTRECAFCAAARETGAAFAAPDGILGTVHGQRNRSEE